MIRLIAFDMDGTVLNDEKKILKETNINEDIRVKNLTEDQLTAIRTEVAKSI